MAFAQQSKTILNERERKQAALSISIFGAEMVSQIWHDVNFLRPLSVIPY